MKQTRLYDAEGHFLGNNADAALDPAGGALKCGGDLGSIYNWANGDDNYTYGPTTPEQQYYYGPDGHLVSDGNGGGIVYWDGDKPFFGGGHYFIDDFAYGGNAGVGQVIDRDFTGMEAAAHDSGGHGVWGIDDPAEWNSCDASIQTYLPQGTDGASPTGALYMPKPDGLSDGTVTVQGARAYDPQLGSWTAPDPYQGDVEDPLSLRSYMWNGNNPFKYSDPSGYDAVPITITLDQLKNAASNIAHALQSAVDVIGTFGLGMVGAFPGENGSAPSATRGKGNSNTPKSNLPRDSAGRYQPHPDAQGPHTTLGTRTGSDG